MRATLGIGIVEPIKPTASDWKRVQAILTAVKERLRLAKEVPMEAELIVRPDFNPNAARLNLTYAGLNGDLPDPVPYDATDADIRRMATEALVNGGIPGIARQPNVRLDDFVVERFAATEDLPFPRIVLRPKTPFG